MALNFGDAIQALKDGKSVSRNGWNGKNMRLFLVKGLIPCESVELSDEDLKATLEDKENIITHIEGLPISIFTGDELTPNNHMPHIIMVTPTGTFVHGWLASQTDMLAEDWGIVEVA